MTTAADWIEGARLRTLPAAVSPVAAGSAVAWQADRFVPGMAVLALVVALALQVGVNYANDYSDGVRGTDAERVGPMRLVGSGAATPEQVKRAAFGCFGLAALAGLALCAWSGAWWMLGVGALAILAAWGYTGGKNPYGYLGLGEIFVFLFFGLVATAGTSYVMTRRIGAAAVLAACAIGLLACAILMANNLRDIDSDARVGKRTLAVRLGDHASRIAYAGMLVLAVLCCVGVAVTTTWWALLGLVGLPLLAVSAARVLRGATGKPLIGVLKTTGIAELVMSLGLLAGAIIAGA